MEWVEDDQNYELESLKNRVSMSQSGGLTMFRKGNIQNETVMDL